VTALLDEGLAISRDLRMGPLMERILSRREILRASVLGSLPSLVGDCQGGEETGPPIALFTCSMGRVS